MRNGEAMGSAEEREKVRGESLLPERHLKIITLSTDTVITVNRLGNHGPSNNPACPCGLNNSENPLSVYCQKFPKPNLDNVLQGSFFPPAKRSVKPLKKHRDVLLHSSFKLSKWRRPSLRKKGSNIASIDGGKRSF